MVLISYQSVQIYLLEVSDFHCNTPRLKGKGRRCCLTKSSGRAADIWANISFPGTCWSVSCSTELFVCGSSETWCLLSTRTTPVFISTKASHLVHILVTMLKKYLKGYCSWCVFMYTRLGKCSSSFLLDSLLKTKIWQKAHGSFLSCWVKCLELLMIPFSTALNPQSSATKTFQTFQSSTGRNISASPWNSFSFFKRTSPLPSYLAFTYYKLSV